ncbi:glycine/D-amino acid oxidase-like deaminating enzyme [Prauserella sediminis]|uniref:Glycine/D-amino acid oxidase-like deaminating enzyme n=1 Tax=Prauserella sediminis TaxID=577680 RepID=A0A839XRW1_9PSEU|nr:FAD-binding oxidoreductase [Prauserella sediminis]MBB3665467.1 glycine/D-amino acid oxidase-like deaminating enzyme [Prauserella sediminis]
MKLTSYWYDTAQPSGDYRRTEVPETVDVAIVGGGLTGLSAALELARHGATVAVLEAETMGWGASGRNGGMATTGLAIGIGTAIARYGRERAIEMHLEYERAINTVESLVDELGIECDFERFGKLALAVTRRDLEGLRSAQAEINSIPDLPDVTVLDRSELGTEIGSPYYVGGMVDPRGAGLHVGKFVHGLAGAAASWGAQLCEAAAVQSISRRGTRHTLQTTRGTVDAGEVLIATSGYTGGTTPWLRRRVLPVGSFIVVTEPLSPELAASLLPNGRMASDSKMLTYYFRLTPDNRLLFGGRARFALSNPDSDLRSAKILKRAMSTVFPQLASARIDYTWGGLVDITVDQMVHTGVNDGMHYSLGYSGHGVQMAAHSGREVGRYLAGKSDAYPWSDLKFPAVPGHFGPPWFLPFVGAGAHVIDGWNKLTGGRAR